MRNLIEKLERTLDKFDLYKEGDEVDMVIKEIYNEIDRNDPIKVQVKLQQELQGLGYNIISCCNCGTVLIHKMEDENINCTCGEIDVNSCSDLYYEGMQSN